MTGIKKGKYQHFKGNFYEVIGVARHSENLEEEFVVYRQLYKSEAIEDLYIRPLKMFLEEVERDGQRVPRFKYVGNI